MTYNILDEELEGYLQLVKIDIETGKPVKIVDTTFNLYYIAEDGRETLCGNERPKNPAMPGQRPALLYRLNGEMKTPEKLPLGKYRIVEIEGPHGYFNDRQYNVVFELTSNRVYQVSGGSADGMDDYVITENYYNHETLGQIKIRKIGNVLTGYENGQSSYETITLPMPPMRSTRRATFPRRTIKVHLVRRRRPLSPPLPRPKMDRWTKSGSAPTRTTATYDFLKVTHDGTKGEVKFSYPAAGYLHNF